MSEPMVTMLGTEATRQSAGETLWYATFWYATFGDCVAEIVHVHGTRVLYVRELRDGAMWDRTELDFNAALDLARRLVTPLAEEEGER